MNKILSRLPIFILIPCLIADPGLASVFADSQPLIIQNSSLRHSFVEQALTLRFMTQVRVALKPTVNFDGITDISSRQHQETEQAGLTRIALHPRSIRRLRLATLLALAFFTLASGRIPTPTWADEFDGPAGSLPDSSKWTYDLGGGGWGNQELEVYTNSPNNVSLDGKGFLSIKAIRTSAGITSARIKTKGLFSAGYGHLEARIKLPFGNGLWPAFWELGEDFPTTPWPQSGEIDIMEHIGKLPDSVNSALHGPGYSGGSGPVKRYYLPSGQRFSDSFHIFSVDRTPNKIVFSIDGVPYNTFTPASIPPGAVWVFNKPFFIILNVAVGGQFPGPPDATTQFPQQMLVDYVRYTQAEGVAPPASVAAPRVIASSPQGTGAAQQVLIAGPARKLYDDGIAYSSGIDNPDDLSKYKFLIFDFGRAQAGTKFLARIIPQGASYDGETGLHRTTGRPTIFTIDPNGVAVVPNDPASYGLTADQLKQPLQLSLTSGSTPWGKYPLGQSGSRHADFTEVRGTNQAPPVRGGVVMSRLMDHLVPGLRALAAQALAFFFVPVASFLGVLSRRKLRNQEELRRIAADA